MYENVSRNKRMSAFIMVAFVVFITGVVYVFARGMGYGLDMVGFALIFSGIGSFLSYYTSDSIILGLSGARPASRKKDFKFYTVTENLAMAARLPKPRLYVIEDTAMNAFATGRDPQHAVICATTGLLNRMNRTELEGVIAHELSHIRNYDIRLMSIVSVLVGLIALLADWFLRMSYWGGGKNRNNDNGGQLQTVFFVIGIVLAMLSPLIAQLIQLAISRRREFLADASGTALTKYPNGLISALQKLNKDTEPLEAANKATAHLYITNPLKNQESAVGWFANMFNTHPPIAERIKALRGET
ncbi:MAG: Protease HtpX-like protein [Microgenomates group bacterium GW2011_GWA1_46_15]|nr:MAG: Protease HtpX-like protein [Microgenomates group bacterium GW2011_GWB1_45_17]KKU23608.1 MAG: Protease HtpX-like protein [Microgenomates group bacterium GW2011_GWC1_46_15]KKU24327.1 MAG: Protease HtpX-like protein [Microgenomates group bacterium GW2011_GWA1_46_15]